jgi:hypothetical protein
MFHFRWRMKTNMSLCSANVRYLVCSTTTMTDPRALSSDVGDAAAGLIVLKNQSVNASSNRYGFSPKLRRQYSSRAVHLLQLQSGFSQLCE